MKIRDSVAFVTGANRGVGLAFAQELLAGGARKVYAAARQPERITLATSGLAGVEPVRLDVTNPQDVAAAARQCSDVNLLINNAGIALWTGFLAPDSVEAARSEMETNYYGPLLLSRAFAPVLARNGGGAIVNLLSVLSWVAVPSAGTYSASKAAAWALTNWLRTPANMIKEGSTRNRETTMINNPAEDSLAFVQYDDRICQTWCASSPGKLSARER